MQKNNLGELLKEEREKRGLSLREFSAKLNISHTFLNKLEKGSDQRSDKVLIPSTTTLNKIADALDISRNVIYEMCGHIKDDADTQSINSKTGTIDLNDFRMNIKSLFLNADSVTDGDRELSADEVRLLVNALIMSVDLITKKGTV